MSFFDWFCNWVCKWNARKEASGPVRVYEEKTASAQAELREQRAGTAREARERERSETLRQRYIDEFEVASRVADAAFRRYRERS